MIKIQQIQFRSHPILGDLALDFRDASGRTVDTVLLAGGNGAGKTAVLEALYALVSRDSKGIKFDADVVYEVDGVERHFTYVRKADSAHSTVSAQEAGRRSVIVSLPSFAKSLPTEGIFAGVGISFSAKKTKSVTSMTLDADGESRRSTDELATQINQLIVDMQSQDEASFYSAAHANPTIPTEQLRTRCRMDRFATAFSRMFDDLSYKRVRTSDGHKEAVFLRGNTEIPISALSSGEKQVVYRGCFLLRDTKALEGAFVFIDEPEISMHPEWQLKIMDYYKAMFTNEDGLQTSQLFCATHSPFIIHAPNRFNDKVIVLERDNADVIRSLDKPEYYYCNSVQVVQDAFNTHEFATEAPTVYVEGKTDEQYFKRAAQVMGDKLPFEFQAISKDEPKQSAKSGGAESLKQAARAYANMRLAGKKAFVFDCDTNIQNKREGNVLKLKIPANENAAGIKKGIENALVLDDIEIAPERFYEEKKILNSYGGPADTKHELRKTELCNYICGLDDEVLQKVFANLFTVIEELRRFFDDKEEALAA